MDSKVCETYEEAIEFFKEYKKNHPNFKGNIVIEFNEHRSEDKKYNEGLETACINEFSAWLQDHPYFYDARFDLSSRHDYRLAQGRSNFLMILENELYNGDGVDSRLFTSSIYNNQSSPCYINIFKNSNMDQKMKMNALVHEYNNRFLCIEIPDAHVYYFKGMKNLLTVRTMADAEGVIHGILSRKYDIDYTRKLYGY